MNGAYSGEMVDQDLHEAGTLVAHQEDGAAGVAALAAPVALAAPAAVRAGSVVRSEHVLGLHLKQDTNRSCLLIKEKSKTIQKQSGSNLSLMLFVLIDNDITSLLNLHHPEWRGVEDTRRRSVISKRNLLK